MTNAKISNGTAHKTPVDLRLALQNSTEALELWEAITPLARNEWICWTILVKTNETRKRHVERAIDELLKGQRRPCCWYGCTHRTDKTPSPSQKYILKK